MLEDSDSNRYKPENLLLPRNYRGSVQANCLDTFVFDEENVRVNITILYKR